MKIEVGKRYKLYQCEGRVIAVDRNHQTHPVVFLTDTGSIYCYTKEGFYNETPGDLDLQEIPKSMWINVYEDDIFRHPTREIADNCAAKNINKRIACVEAKEGDGL
jgi:hypothetical protein